MFAWLGKLLGKRLAQQDVFDLYQPEERRIYHYFNGQTIIHIDPMFLYKKLMQIGVELDIELKVAASASKDALKSHDRALDRIRSVFSLQPLAEGGLTEEECLELLQHFFRYLDQVKKNSRPSSISWSSSEASAPSSAESPATLSSSACGFAADVSTTDAAPSSLAESASLSA